MRLIKYRRKLSFDRELYYGDNFYSDFYPASYIIIDPTAWRSMMETISASYIHVVDGLYKQDSQSV